MILNYTLKKEELYSFHNKSILNSLYYKMFWLIMFIWINIVWSIIATSIQYKLKSYVLVGFSILLIILFIFRKTFFLRNFRKVTSKSVYSNCNRKYLFTNTTLEINDMGITIDTDFNNRLIEWRYVKDLYIINNKVLIRSFINDNILIPSSVIKSKEDLNRLLNIFKDNASIYPRYGYPRDINL